MALNDKHNELENGYVHCDNSDDSNCACESFYGETSMDGRQKIFNSAIEISSESSISSIEKERGRIMSDDESIIEDLEDTCDDTNGIKILRLLLR